MKKIIRINGDAVELTVKNPFDMLISLFEAIGKKDRKLFLQEQLDNLDANILLENDKVVEAILFESPDYHTEIFYKSEKGEEQNYNILYRIHNLIHANPIDGTYYGLTDDQIENNLSVVKQCLKSLVKPEEYE